MNEHDFEPVRGLPGALPDGERILWQGGPDWRALALRAFHVRSVAVYFVALFAWRGWSEAAAGAGAIHVLTAAALTLPTAIVTLALLCGLAWITARMAVYTITDRRVVLRIGVALPKAINIPFAIVGNAAVKTHADGSGDVVLTLTPPNKIAYFMLWPHARPFRLARPEPALRAIADAAAVAAILAPALAAAHGQRLPLSPAATAEPVGDAALAPA